MVRFVRLQRAVQGGRVLVRQGRPACLLAGGSGPGKHVSFHGVLRSFSSCAAAGVSRCSTTHSRAKTTARPVCGTVFEILNCLLTAQEKSDQNGVKVKDGTLLQTERQEKTEDTGHCQLSGVVYLLFSKQGRVLHSHFGLCRCSNTHLSARLSAHRPKQIAHNTTNSSMKKKNLQFAFTWPLHELPTAGVSSPRDWAVSRGSHVRQDMVISCAHPRPGAPFASRGRFPPPSLKSGCQKLEIILPQNSPVPRVCSLARVFCSAGRP